MSADEQHEAAMKSVANKTLKPVSVPLPRGKTLHLGPGKTGQISSEAAEHPMLKKLVESGTIELSDDVATSTAPAAVGRTGPQSFHGHATGGGGRRSGDR